MRLEAILDLVDQTEASHGSHLALHRDGQESTSSEAGLPKGHIAIVKRQASFADRDCADIEAWPEFVLGRHAVILPCLTDLLGRHVEFRQANSAEIFQFGPGRAIGVREHTPDVVAALC
jgi:hypothetical protein